MTGKWLAGLLLMTALEAQAQIYRCETAEGLVYSDQRCSAEASEVQLAEDSQGLGGGPSEEVRAYLDQKRQERAEQRENAAQRAQEPSTTVIVQPAQPAEPAALLPGYLRPVRPVHPIVRPRPRPERPRPPVSGGEESGSTLGRPRPGPGG